MNVLIAISYLRNDVAGLGGTAQKDKVRRHLSSLCISMCARVLMMVIIFLVPYRTRNVPVPKLNQQKDNMKWRCVLLYTSWGYEVPRP